MSSIPEILLFVLTAALIIFVFWERLNVHKLIQKQIELAEGVSKTFQKDAEVRGEELQSSHSILYHVMEDAKEERGKYMENLQLFADRFMSWGDLQKYALMNSKQTSTAPQGHPMSDDEEARIEQVNQLQQQGYTQEQAIDLIRMAEENPTSLDAMQQRQEQVKEELLEGM